MVHSKVVRNLGAFFDNHLSMEEHVINTTQAAYYHLRRLKSIRKYLSKEKTERLVHAFITSKLDINNGLLLGITKEQLYSLEKVQHSAARLITGVRVRDHITPVLKDLHWLPVKYRPIYKLCLLVFKCLH